MKRREPIKVKAILILCLLTMNVLKAEEPEIGPDAPDLNLEDSAEPLPILPAEIDPQSIQPAVNAPPVENKEQQLISLNFQNTEISLVLKFFSDITGLTFILGDNVRGNVTVISTKRIPVAEALDMLQSILEIKGFTMVRSGEVVKVVTQNEAMQKNIEIKTFASPTRGDDRVVTQMIPLKHVVANDIKGGLQPLISRNGTILVDERTNTIILTDVGSNINKIMKIIDYLDVGTYDAAENTRVFFLQNSKAGEMAKLLNEIIAKPGVNVIERSISIVIDERTNALIVTTAPQNFANLQKIIEKIDVRTPQVLIKALLVEVSLTKENKLGFEWNYARGWGEHNPGISGTLSQRFGIANFIGDGMAYSILDSDQSFSAIVQALATDQKVNILSTPQILTSNNQEATIKVGEDVPFLGKVTTTKNEVTGQIEVLKVPEYRPVNLEFKVIPRINNKKDVAMKMHLSVKKILGMNAELNAPIIANREAETDVVVEDGQTIVIGGLIKDDDSYSDSKIPLLGDIPILGWLFKKQGSKRDKTELMVFITPYVALNSAEAAKLSKEQDAKISIKNTPYRVTAKQLFEQGKDYYRKKNYQQAIESWKKVIEIDPTAKLARNAERYIAKAETKISQAKPK